MNTPRNHFPKPAAKTHIPVQDPEEAFSRITDTLLTLGKRNGLFHNYVSRYKLYGDVHILDIYALPANYNVRSDESLIDFRVVQIECFPHKGATLYHCQGMGNYIDEAESHLVTNMQNLMDGVDREMLGLILMPEDYIKLYPPPYGSKKYRDCKKPSY